jgi:hypothetical protein
MNLFETLKQFKNIKADSSYTEKSRLVVLASPQHEPMGTRFVFGRIFGTAGSIALAGIIVFIVAGGLSISRYFLPVSFQGIDPAALHAEAQAIDMQINLANLNYTESLGASSHSTPISANTPKGTPLPANAPVSTQGIGNASATSTMATGSSSLPATSTMSINDVLQKLAQ